MIARERQLDRRPGDDLARRVVDDGAARIAPTARIADWGGLMTAEKLSIPNIPRFETVNVAPDSSAGVIEPSRALATRVRATRAISATRL